MKFHAALRPVVGHSLRLGTKTASRRSNALVGTDFRPSRHVSRTSTSQLYADRLLLSARNVQHPQLKVQRSYVHGETYSCSPVVPASMVQDAEPAGLVWRMVEGCSPFRSLRRMSSFYDRSVTRWSEMTPTVAHVSDLLPPQKVTDEDLINSATAVNSNVAVGLAKRLVRMNSMPHIFGINPEIHRLYHLYYDAFTKLSSIPPPTRVSDAVKLGDGLYSKLLSETAVVIPTLARASKELATAELNGLLDSEELHRFYNTMLSGRILRRLLMYNHLMLQKMYLDPDADLSNLSVISDDCNILECAHLAFDAARQICLERYSIAPELLIVREPDGPIRYVKSHLVFMLVEIFKNSARAVIEASSEDSDEIEAKLLPPIKFEVFQTAQDIVQIKVSDVGGGYSLGEEEMIFSYGYSTLDLDEHHDQHLQAENLKRPLRGEGFGLPLIKQYAMFFGGNFSMHSTSGHGTEAHLRLHEPRGPAIITGD